MKKQSSTADKENEDDKTVLACKIRVTCSTTENEQETNTACKKENVSYERNEKVADRRAARN